ncbi:MAG TPA: winged helix-turn-helix domain-containing protein [Solirubrobacterales bacterium]|nr:winged helix-turn-helix domain-containing protein [Solirubrobacterales bacterium]
METAESPETHNLLAALRHPLRRRILRAMSPKDELSPRELSKELGQPLSKVSYHVRVLADCGVLQLTRTAQVRGSTQHFYRSTFEARWARSALAEAGQPPRGSKSRGEEIS